jgi:metallo-beta-lactamase family protein
LVDCGVAQGRDRMVFPDEALDAQALILTHGHQDHIGSVPTLLERGWSGAIYATGATLEVAKISLEDSLSMQRLPPSEIRIFMKRFAELARPLPYGTEHRIGAVTLKLEEAGHIIGSASAVLESEKSRVILSGDLGRKNSPILQDPCVQWGMRPVDLVVMESTYGNREHAHSHDDIEHDLEEILKDAIARRARVLIPAFAIGRTQVLLYFLNRLVESGRIAKIPVAIDTPMGLAITDTYKHFEKLFDKESLEQLARGDDPLDFEALFCVKRGRDSARLDDLPGPMVIIAGSGMCTGGRIVGHLRQGLPSESTTVLFVGYQGEGTQGRRIQTAAKNGGTVRIDREDVVVRARVETLKGLSAHADRTELLAWLKCIPSVRRVALHHGDVAAQEDFTAWATPQLRS